MRQLLPGEFILSDEWATNHVTLEDALSHRTGCARHDLSLAKDPQDALRRLQHLPMATEPRVKFHYSNMMYAVAGYLVEKLAGMTLSTFFHKYLWEPMHLNETFLGLYDPALNTSGLLVADEYYYNKLTDDYMRIDHPDVSPDEGAGAVVSNVLDYAKYLRVMMDEGAPLSKAGHRELKTPRSFYQPSGPPFVGPMTYTLGWMSGIFQGEQIWLHSGQVNMFTTWMLMVPSRGFGIAVMTNSASKAMTLVLYRIIYDLFDVEDKDRFDFAAKYGRSPKASQFKLTCSRFKNDEHDQDRYLATCSKRLYPHLPSPPLAPTVPLANHTGIFYDAGYGEVVVFDTCDTAAMDSEESLSADNACQLRLRKDDGHSTEYTLLLEHKSGDHWLARGELWDSGVTVFCAEAEFRVDAAGIVVQVGLNIRLEDEVPFIWFTRVE